MFQLIMGLIGLITLVLGIGLLLFAELWPGEDDDRN